MNTQQNKAYLWKQCIEQGIFNTLNSSELPNVQKRFEELVKEYDKIGDTLEVKNGQFLRDFRTRLVPSFEETQKEYDKLLQPPKPTPVEFTREPDKPMQDLTALLEKTNERRKEEIQQVFADKPVGQTLGQPMGQTLGQTLSQTMSQPFGQPLQSDPLERIERLITKQTEMILSVLETQMKLIDYLQRNKK
jgi:hypothetical protein